MAAVTGNKSIELVKTGDEENNRNKTFFSEMKKRMRIFALIYLICIIHNMHMTEQIINSNDYQLKTTKMWINVFYGTLNRGNTRIEVWKNYNLKDLNEPL